MANSLYQSLNSNNNMVGMIRQFRQFSNAFRGDPKSQVQALLNSGRMTQEQFNQYQNMANQMMDAMKH